MSVYKELSEPEWVHFEAGNIIENFIVKAIR